MAEDLLDSVEVEYSIECIACCAVGESSERSSPEAAAAQFRVDGWKRNEDGEVNCPECWASSPE